MRWRAVALGDIQVQKGGSVDPRNYPSEQFELYSIPAFDAGRPDLVVGSEIGSSKKCVQPNDVMISRIVPHIRRACVVGPSNGLRQIASGEWIVFRSDKIWPNYLRWVLVGDAFHSAFMKTVSGVGGSLLRARPTEVAKIEIPLPPLAEQKRIAAILDAADAVRAKRRQTLAELDTLLQSTFLDMFGDPVTNPKGWETTFLPNLATKLTDGPFGSNLKSSHYVSNGVRVIRLQNVGIGEMLHDDLAYISREHYHSLPRNHCHPGDVIIATLGDPNLRACIIPPQLQESLNKADCLALRVDQSKAVNSYVCWLLNCDFTVAKALELVRGQTRGRISLGRIRELEIPLPPLSLQHQFAAIVESVEQQKARMRAHFTELDTLFASLQSRAFKGEL